MRLVIGCWTAWAVGLALLMGRPGNLRPPGRPWEAPLLVPFVVAGGEQVILRHQRGMGFADEAWALPLVGQPFREYLISDPGMPGFLLHPTVGLAELLGGWPLLASVMIVTWSALVVAVWWWARRRLSAPAAWLVTAVVCVVPETSVGLMDQLVQIRAYALFVPLCTVGLAVAASKSTPSRDGAVFGLLGLASLDNPLCLSVLFGYGASASLRWIRRGRFVQVERLGAALTLFACTVGVNAWVAASDQVARSGRAGEDWVVAQLLIAAVPVAVVTRHGPGVDAAWAWLLGAVATGLAVMLGVLPDAQRMVLFLAPAGWLLGIFGVLRFTEDRRWPRIVTALSLMVVWSLVHTSDIGRVFQWADPFRWLWRVGLFAGVVWTALLAMAVAGRGGWKVRVVYRGFAWFTGSALALSLAGDASFRSGQLQAKRSALMAAWASSPPVYTTSPGVFHLLPPGALAGLRVTGRASAYEVLGDQLTRLEEPGCGPGTWVIRSSHRHAMERCGCDWVFTPPPGVSGPSVAVCH